MVIYSIPAGLVEASSLGRIVIGETVRQVGDHMEEHPHYQTMQAVNRQLRVMWVRWGLIPLGCALILLVVTSALRHTVPLSPEPEQLALGFKAVMAIGAALFLLGFWLDGRWTEAQRIARTIWVASGGNGHRPSKRDLSDHADLAMSNLVFSTKALTVIGLLIGLAAVLASLAGLRFDYSIQILLLALAFQLFIYSRHPYYRELMEAALRGDLVVEEKSPGKR